MRLLNHLAALLAATMLSFNCTAQPIPNAQTVAVKIYGNCGMCKKTIEKAALQKGAAKADWDNDTQTAQLTFDSTRTNADEILQRIAAAGYDSEQFRATDAAYANLHSCCQYERPAKPDAVAVPPSVPNVAPPSVPDVPPAAPKTGMVKKTAMPQPEAAAPAASPLAEVYAAYFLLKDALVASDGSLAAAHAKTLFKAVDNVKMDALAADQHKVWMKYQSKISYDAEHIKGVTDVEHQREHFVTLSDNLFAVMKTIRPEGGETYLDHCPMANGNKGANWISRDQAIKNPYFGKSMLTCGKVQETLKN